MGVIWAHLRVILYQVVPDDYQMIQDDTEIVPDDSQMVSDDYQLVPHDSQMVPYDLQMVSSILDPLPVIPSEELAHLNSTVLHRNIPLEKAKVEVEASIIPHKIIITTEAW